MKEKDLYYDNYDKEDEEAYYKIEAEAKPQREKYWDDIAKGSKVEPYWDKVEREAAAGDERRNLLHDCEAVEVEFEKELIGLDHGYSIAGLILFVAGTGEPKSGLFELLVRNKADVENFDYYVNYYIENSNPFLRATFVNYYPEYCDADALANDPHEVVREAVAEQKLRLSEIIN